MSADTNQSIIQSDIHHVFHSWSVQNQLNPLAFKTGKGCVLIDYDGKEYLDFSSQLVNTNVGHQHPKVIEGIIQQAQELCTISPAHANKARGLAAQKILEVAPKGFKKIFFTNAGADAIENAIRMARLFTGRRKVLSAYRSYHGNTGAAISATGDTRRFNNEYAQDHVHFFGPYLYRSEFWSSTEQEECERALHHLRRIVECENPANIACILLESIPGTAGVFVPPKGYVQGVRQLCDEFGIMLILDEVMVGFGRTGKWFAQEHYEGVTPDLITFAKGVNSGYIPVGGVIISDAISQYFDDKYFPGGLTYSGHPLAMASIVANITAMQEEKMVENAEKMGEILAIGLKKLVQKHAIIGEVRGIGLFWAIELVSNPEQKTKFTLAEMNKVKQLCLDNGLLPFIAENRIHVAPPLIVTEAQIHQALAIYDTVLSQMA
ncbi:aspartate aminotransferase family protein [Pelistega sp. NLN82]|uniref:Aspartate aminotransferase family protein n=1 Tax=Pelistega ratti TaxID=2652177 RepID=A0A6L9Y4X3_9BURK|nr:aspartate aminotransferase family protein [Pelistega ratti]NEN74854.1 aspartate aminotransferase family protein [Pelistega ratti]